MRDVLTPLWGPINGFWLASQADKCFHYDEDSCRHEQRDQHSFQERSEGFVVSHTILRSLELLQLVGCEEEQCQY